MKMNSTNTNSETMAKVLEAIRLSIKKPFPIVVLNKKGKQFARVRAIHMSSHEVLFKVEDTSGQNLKPLIMDWLSTHASQTTQDSYSRYLVSAGLGKAL